MTDYFTTPERIAAIQAEAKSWIGTPFIDGIGARAEKQTAGDCVGWCAKALGAVGAIGPVPWPTAYASENSSEEMFAVLIGVLDHIPNLSRIWTRPPPNLQSLLKNPISQRPAMLPGDLMVGTRGRAGHHMAMFWGDNRIVHCWHGRVREGSVGDSMLAKHLHSIYRSRHD